MSSSDVYDPKAGGQEEKQKNWKARRATSSQKLPLPTPTDVHVPVHVANSAMQECHI
jgi:hypothetical protein